MENLRNDTCKHLQSNLMMWAKFPIDPGPRGSHRPKPPIAKENLWPIVGHI